MKYCIKGREGANLWSIYLQWSHESGFDKIYVKRRERGSDLNIIKKNPLHCCKGFKYVHLRWKTGIKLITHITHSTTAHWRHCRFFFLRLVAYYTFSS